MRLLFLDTETTGLDPEKDVITELGYVIYEVEKKQVLRVRSNFLIDASSPGISKEIEEITGINNEMVSEWGYDAATIYKQFTQDALKASYIVAHNAEFDKSFVSNGINRHLGHVSEYKWIDTMTDIKFSKKAKSRSLNYLCADYGISPNDLAHRALFDVFQTIKLFDKFDYKEIIARSEIPNITVRALCEAPFRDSSPEGEKEVDVAKAHGFRWDGPTKSWIKKIKLSDLEELEAAITRFKIKEVK